MKRLVICCDGTWNRGDQEVDGEPCPTNVVRLAYRISKSDGNGVPQVVFYDHGVGTGNTLDRITGGAFGEGIEENIEDAYRFLFANYEEGDELFFFGFSRGAFTARSVVGMIRKCGILSRRSARMYRSAVQLYKSKEIGPDAPEAREFRAAHSVSGDRPINVQFIGVWDTVGALGVPVSFLRKCTAKKHQFHDTELSGLVKNACHALAIDELRSPFEPTLWAYKPKEGQRVVQMWFAGAHSDVGGGYAKERDKEWAREKPVFKPQLSDISLAWMMREAEKSGLAFDEGAIKEVEAEAQPLATIHDSRTGIYNLTRPLHRAVGFIKDGNGQQLDPTQFVHDSVLHRWDHVPGYRPPGLRRYLEAIRDPRASN